jgi:hypothetical protein
MASGPNHMVFETFVLDRREFAYTPFAASFRKIFNANYQLVGKKNPRPERGL